MNEQAGLTGRSELVRLGDEEETTRVLSQAILGLWEVVNNLTRLRPARSLRYRVTIFGSARTEPGHWAYAAVRDLAAELTCLGCDIVTGGGPGLMQAANEGPALPGRNPNDLPSESALTCRLSRLPECDQVLDLLREHHSEWKAQQEAAS